MNTTKTDQIIKSLESADYRSAFVESRCASTVAFQIRAIREQREWTQADLGDRCGKAQGWISQIENPQYGRHSMQTLLSLAHVFDCDLEVRFRPFTQLIGWLSNRRAGDLRVASYSADLGSRSSRPFMENGASADSAGQLLQVHSQRRGMARMTATSSRVTQTETTARPGGYR
jgi:transcriptional regulator with XRE-family HTH domain